MCKESGGEAKSEKRKGGPGRERGEEQRGWRGRKGRGEEAGRREEEGGEGRMVAGLGVR